MDTIRLVLAEDHTIVRQGLRAILEQQPGIDVIAEVENGRAAAQIAEKLKPDVVLMDFSMPDLNGLEATRQIKQRAPDVKVLILSRHANQEYVKSSLRAGASGYLNKKTALGELIIAIQSVARGDFYFDHSLPEIDRKRFLHQSREVIRVNDEKSLTPRQREVLQLIAEGHPNREIASLLHISVKTVANHRANLLQKLDLNSTADVVQYAIQKGIISQND